MRTIAFLMLVSLNSNTFSQVPFDGRQAIVKSEFIYQPGDVPFPSCHASTIAETRSGLIAAWFGGTEERNPDVGIWVSNFRNGKWSKPVEVANGIQHKSKRYPCWNPVLFNNGKKILLFYKVGPTPREWWGELKVSNDEGETWEKASRLPEDIYGPIKNKPVLLNNGELLCPSSTENEGWRVHMEITSGNGSSWERTPALNKKDTAVIQPTLLILLGNDIEMLCRSKSSRILSSHSVDNGHTWSPFKATPLPNPNSGIDAVSLSDGRQMVVYNHLVEGRNILNVSVSDDGKNWKAAVLLENDQNTDSEFSYPAVIQTKDGMVHITYTWNRKQIKHVIIDPSKLTLKTFQSGSWPTK
jgi:predicted neuraminidase